MTKYVGLATSFFTSSALGAWSKAGSSDSKFTSFTCMSVSPIASLSIACKCYPGYGSFKEAAKPIKTAQSETIYGYGEGSEEIDGAKMPEKTAME